VSGRLGGVKPKEFIRRLKKVGFCVDHQTGSHITLINEKGTRLVVPYHVKEMKKGLVCGLLKQCGISQEEFAKIR